MRSLVFALSLLLLATSAPADRVTLKNGTVLEGDVIQQGERYWIKTADGKSHWVTFNQVLKIERDAPASPDGDGSAAFRAAQGLATGGVSPLNGVAVWLRFLDNNPAPAEAAKAREQLEVWLTRAREGHEKLHGKWMTPQQRDAIAAKAGALYTEAKKLAEEKKPVPALTRLKEAMAIYPTSVWLNFNAGSLALMAQKTDDARDYYQQCILMRPWCYEAMNNLGLLKLFQQDIQGGWELLVRAAKVNPLPQIARNLIVAERLLTDRMRIEPRNAEGVEMAKRLSASVIFSAPEDPARSQWGADAQVRGVLCGGSGTLVAEDLLLTTHDVVSQRGAVLVMLDDDTILPGTIHASDRQSNLALVKIKPPRKLSPVGLAEAPLKEGACRALATTRPTPLDAQAFVMEGQAKTVGKELRMEAKLAPGTTGAAVVDDAGRVVGLLAQPIALSGPSPEAEAEVIPLDKIKPFLLRSRVAPVNSPDGELPDRAKAAAVSIIVVK